MRYFLAAACLFLTTWVCAAGLDQLSNAEASRGLKDALVQSADSAIAKLGTINGFLANPKVRIPLPEHLQRAEKTMRMLGMGKQADELVLRMNRAAEEAVPQGRQLLIDAVKKMSMTDAKAIITGGDDAATQYFRKTTSGPMMEKFLPIVQKAMQDVKLAQQYNQLAKLGNRYHLVGKDQVSMEQYITQKALDGVYLMMAEEEKKIRQDPVKAGSSLATKIFKAATQ
jgi:hypothetical protein